jgi:hypothetical protein
MKMQTMRSVVLAALTLSFLMPVTALAGRGHNRDRDVTDDSYGQRNRRGGEGRRHAPNRGFITVTNDNSAALEVLVDRQVVGTVQARQTARFGAFELGTHKVRVRYIANGLRFPVLRERVDLQGRHPARIVAPVLDTGIVTLKNTWIEPMVVKLNGRTIDRVAGNSRKTIRIDGAYGTLQFVTPKGNVATSRDLRLNGLERGDMTLITPSEGSVTIVNPSNSHSLDVLCSRGMVLATVPPSSRRRLTQPAGKVTLTAAYRGTPIQTTSVIASPFDRSRWAIDLPDYAALSVRNPNTFPVNVYASGTLLGQVEGRSRAFFPSVAAGWTQLEMTTGRRNRSLSTVTVDIDPLSGGLLTVPRLAVNDGRRGDSEYCEQGAVAERPDYRDRSQRRRGRRYASNRGW